MVKTDKRVDSKGRTRTQIRAVEGYCPGKGQAAKQRTIRDFGCLEDQPDPIAFMKTVRLFNETYKNENPPLRVDVSSGAKMYSVENRSYNYGYKFLEGVYNSLNIESFIGEYVKRKGFRGDYAISNIFKFLVMMRLMSPDSRRASFQMKEKFYGMATNFTLSEVYKALDNISDFEVDLQRHLNAQRKGTVGRDLSYAFYDVTNFFLR